jgi:drug/metabolite transporter (DMT)-like permease
MNAILGQTLAVLTAACFATVSTVWSYVGKRIGSNSVTHIRLWLSVPPIIIVHYLFTGYLFPHFIDSTALILFLVSGVFGFAVADLFIFRSLILIGVRETLVILTLSPIFGALISWLAIDETLTYLQILGIMVTVGGVMWVIREEDQNRRKENKVEKLGIPFALAGALAQALANILSKGGLMLDVHPISGTYLRIMAGLLSVALFSAFRRSFIEDIRKMRHISLTALLFSAAMIGPIAGVIISLYALTMAPVGIVTALIQVSPILLLPFDHFILKKKITWKVVAGTFIAIGGAAILFIY